MQRKRFHNQIRNYVDVLTALLQQLQHHGRQVIDITVNARPESTLWEADFEEILEKAGK